MRGEWEGRTSEREEHQIENHQHLTGHYKDFYSSRFSIAFHDLLKRIQDLILDNFSFMNCRTFNFSSFPHLQNRIKILRDC